MSGNEETSRTVRNDPPPSGTHAGADATSRMSGIHTTDPYPDGKDTGSSGGIRHTDDAEVRTVQGTDHSRTDDSRTDGTHGKHVAAGEVIHEDRGRKILPAKTSAAATFALVFGLAALFCALTAILAPAAVLFGLIGIVLGIVAMKMVKRPGVTGKGVGIGGLVTAVLGLLLGLGVIAGAAVIVNDDAQLDQIQERVDDLRADLPSLDRIQEEVPG